MPLPKNSFVEYEWAPKHSLQAGETDFSVQNSADSSNSFIGSARYDSRHRCLRRIAEIRFPQFCGTRIQHSSCRVKNTSYVFGMLHRSLSHNSANTKSRFARKTTPTTDLIVCRKLKTNLLQIPNSAGPNPTTYHGCLHHSETIDSTDSAEFQLPQRRFQGQLRRRHNPPSQALLAAQQGPHPSRIFTTIRHPFFQVFLFQRLRFRIPPTARHYRWSQSEKTPAAHPACDRLRLGGRQEHESSQTHCIRIAP